MKYMYIEIEGKKIKVVKKDYLYLANTYKDEYELLTEYYQTEAEIIRKGKSLIGQFRDSMEESKILCIPFLAIFFIGLHFRLDLLTQDPNILKQCLGDAYYFILACNGIVFGRSLGQTIVKAGEAFKYSIEKNEFERSKEKLFPILRNYESKGDLKDLLHCFEIDYKKNKDYFLEKVNDYSLDSANQKVITKFDSITSWWKYIFIDYIIKKGASEKIVRLKAVDKIIEDTIAWGVYWSPSKDMPPIWLEKCENSEKFNIYGRTMNPSIFVIYQMYYVYEWGCSPRINLLKYEIKTRYEEDKYKYIGANIQKIHLDSKGNIIQIDDNGFLYNDEEVEKEFEQSIALKLK